MTLGTSSVLALILASLIAILSIFGLGAMGLALVRRGAGLEERTLGHGLIVSVAGGLCVLTVVAMVLDWRGSVDAIPGAMCSFGVLMATEDLSKALAIVTALGLLSWITALVARRAFRLSRDKRWLLPLNGIYALSLTTLLASAILAISHTMADRGEEAVTCCTAFVQTARAFEPRLAETLFGDEPALTVNSLFFFPLVLVGLLAQRIAHKPTGARPLLAGMVVLSLWLLPSGLLMAAETLSPLMLQLPHHRCPIEVWTRPLDGPWMLGLMFVGAALPIGGSLVLWVDAQSESAQRVARQVLQVGTTLLAAFAAMAAVHVLLGG